MAKLQKFRVVRSHQGDRFYKRGEVREGTKADFAHLIPHVLEPVEEPAPKAEPTAAEKSSPVAEDKAEPRPVSIPDRHPRKRTE